ncbi:SCAN domain-containing protein 3-like [Oculina patagonica]
MYDALIKLVKGEALPPVKERSRAEKSAFVRYWRLKGNIALQRENGKEVLYLKDRQILRNSEISQIVTDEFHRMKGPGARKLVYSLKENFVGLSQNKIQDILNKDKSHYRRNAKFLNKATLKPIRARDVQVRHQIDLMDMGQKGTVLANGISYRYVLSVMDVFSRFVWLRALSGKCSKAIAKELRGIYLEHGPPLVIQSDQGREFKGAVEKLCREMKIKTIHSRPYHPQSQGKVERSHRSLREKMAYDFLRMSKKGVNWVKQLSIYQSILNEDPKEVLKYKTAFQVYYARKTVSRVHKTGSMSKELLARAGKCHPTEADRNRRSKYASALRQNARAATERCNRRMVNTQLKCNPPLNIALAKRFTYDCHGKVESKPRKRGVTSLRLW